MITNNQIEILSKEEDWAGSSSPVSIGTFNVYLEEHSTYNMEVQGISYQKDSKGMFILESDIDLDSKIIRYDEADYQVDNWDRYKDKNGTFHHIECEFK